MTPPPGCAVERATLKLSGKNVYMSILEQFNPGRVPAERLLRRGSRSCYAIMHFGLNTFSGKEWGYGDEDPAIFTPAAFDAEQIVRACRDGGLSGIILVCKHHDGFCLWPTKTTPYNITRSPFRGGRGDLVREVADACRKYGLEMGFYVSPWDRDHPDYGTPPISRSIRRSCVKSIPDTAPRSKRGLTAPTAETVSTAVPGKPAGSTLPPTTTGAAPGRLCAISSRMR